MTKDEVEAEARLAALEGLATTLYNMVLTVAGLSDDQIASLDKTLLDNAARAAISRFDPAMSDHVSAEVHRALERLLDGAREFRQFARHPPS